LLYKQNRINYLLGPFKNTLKENIVLKHEHIEITTGREEALCATTLIESQHFIMTKTHRLESKASINYC